MLDSSYFLDCDLLSSNQMSEHKTKDTIAIPTTTESHSFSFDITMGCIQK